MDKGDAGVASFFYHLGMAAPRHKKRPLPVLSPDQLAAIGLFAQRFFRDLFDRFRPPFVIVFDSYHRLPKDSPVHEGMAEALAEIPAGGRVVFASRTEPPPSFARLRAGRMIHLVTSDDLRLSPRESQAIVRAAAPGRLSRNVLGQMLEIAGGWTAGLVLLLEQLRRAGPSFRVERRRGAEAVFDYFASEIFKRADGETQKLLLQTAFLPRFSAAMAERLTGLPEAEQILEDLYRGNSFTNRFDENPPVYQYHILFREFLLARGKQTLSEECRLEIRRVAGSILEEAGQSDDAVRRLAEAEDWASLSALIARQAPAAFAQGRGQTLLQWIEAVPEHLREHDPWLLYWRAACRQPFDLRQSGQDSHRAFRLFRDLGDRAVSTYLHVLDDLAPLDDWVADLEVMRSDGSGCPSREVEVAVTNSMLGALILRQPANPQLRRWAERPEALARELPDGDLHDHTLLHLIAYQYWTGDLARASLLADTLGDSIRSRQGSPLARLVVSVFIARLEWPRARPNDLRAIRERIKAAQTWDAVPLRSLIAEAAYAALSIGDRAGAGEFLRQLARVVGKAPRHDLANYHFLVAWDAILVRDLTTALRHAEECVRLILDMGCPAVEALARAFLSQLLHEAGQHDEG